MAYLGIDVGTGGSRALVMDAGGKVVASASAEHQHFASPKPGWAEQDPRDWWKAGGEAVRKALATSGLRAEDIDRKSTRLNSSHLKLSRMPSSA